MRSELDEALHTAETKCTNDRCREALRALLPDITAPSNDEVRRLFQLRNKCKPEASVAMSRFVVEVARLVAREKVQDVLTQNIKNIKTLTCNIL